MINYLNGLKVSVLGFAKSGAAAANLCKAVGAEVLISDSGEKKGLKNKHKLLRGIKTEFGGHSKRILESGLIIKSPGIHGDIEILKRAKKKGIPIWGEIELASRLISPAMIFAVTGTNGKTTTTTLLGDIVKQSGRQTVVAGNIGNSLASQVNKINSGTNVVLEVSSYQLEDSFAFHPNICAVLNVTPDHIEHHYTMKNYILAKERIFRNQNEKDFCILNYDDAACRNMALRCRSKVIFFSRKMRLRNGVYWKNNAIVVNLPNKKYQIKGPFIIPGMHNIENIMAAAAMAFCAEIKPAAIIQTIKRFAGVEHRIEFVAEIKGAKYFNDSKGTNVDSTRVALESFYGNIWLILGGRDKGASYKPLSELIRRKVKGIFLIGEAAPIIRKDLKGASTFYEAGTLKNSVEMAYRKVKPGDIVLLSPACASFDQFKDYEDRGRQFKKLVRALEKK